MTRVSLASYVPAELTGGNTVSAAYTTAAVATSSAMPMPNTTPNLSAGIRFRIDPPLLHDRQHRLLDVEGLPRTTPARGILGDHGVLDHARRCVVWHYPFARPHSGMSVAARTTVPHGDVFGFAPVIHRDGHLGRIRVLAGPRIKRGHTEADAFSRLVAALDDARVGITGLTKQHRVAVDDQGIGCLVRAGRVDRLVHREWRCRLARRPRCP